MTQLYDNIASGAIASWDVSGISQAYNNLKLVVITRGDVAATSVQVRMRFNGDSGSNYNTQRGYSAGAGTGASQGLADNAHDLADSSAANSDAGASTVNEVLIPSYALTTFHKGWTMSAWNPRAYSSGNQYGFFGGGVWRSTVAITQVTIFPLTGNFIAGSRLTIYGLL